MQRLRRQDRLQFASGGQRLGAGVIVRAEVAQRLVELGREQQGKQSQFQIQRATVQAEVDAAQQGQAEIDG